MSFNLGSTKVRRVFESPLVRLMKDDGYRDIYHEGTERLGNIPARRLIIHRFDDASDSELGSGKVPAIEEAAGMLGQLILQACHATAVVTGPRSRSPRRDRPGP